MKQRKRKQWLALWITGTLLGCLLPMRQMPEGKAAEVSELEQTAGGKYGLNNPRINNGVTTWDCIYFGNFPQSGYIPQQEPENPVSGETYEDLDGTKMVYSQWKTVETIEGNSKVVDCAPGYSKIEPIKWRVLSVEGDDAFLMADQNLDCRQYNEKQMRTTWERCTLRSWLNGYGEDQNSLKQNYSEDNFLNNAFTETERNAIMTVPVENTRNPIYFTDGGNNTVDRVYLLSYDELNDPAYGFENLENTDTRKAESTQYAGKGGGILSPNVAWPAVYWTRTPGGSADCVCAVIGGAFVYPYRAVYTQMLIRPVLHLNLAASQGIWTKTDCVTAGTPAETEVPAVVPASESPSTPETTSFPSFEPTSGPIETPETTGRPSSMPTSGPVETPETTSYPSFKSTSGPAETPETTIYPSFKPISGPVETPETTICPFFEPTSGPAETPETTICPFFEPTSGPANTPGEIPSIGSDAGGDNSRGDVGKEDVAGNGFSGSSVSDDSTVSDREENHGQNVNGNEKTVLLPNVGKVINIRIKRQKNSAILKWKKNPEVSGYEIQISRKKNFKRIKKINVKKNLAEYKICGLKPGRKYYIRIRAYQSYGTQSGTRKNAYGKFSTKRKVCLRLLNYQSSISSRLTTSGVPAGAASASSLSED